MKLGSYADIEDDSSPSPDTNDGHGETVVLKVFDVYHTIDEGYEHPMPIFHLICRDATESSKDDSSPMENTTSSPKVERQRWHVEVEGFRPYFLVNENDVSLQTLKKIKQDHRVMDVEYGEESVRGESLVKITAQEPDQIPHLRESFEESLGHWEADIPFERRFLVDTGIKQYVEVPSQARGERLEVGELRTDGDVNEDNRDMDVPPRMAVFDLEVRQSDGSHSVVSEKGTQYADEPITSVAAYDSYTDSYHAWVLAHQSWDERDTAAVKGLTEQMSMNPTIHVFDNERFLLRAFAQWLVDKQFDVMTGWNFVGFDMPYLVNRCFNKDVYDIRGISPTEDVERCHGEGSWINSDVKGVIIFDMLKAFREKMNVNELKSYSLRNVADAVLDEGEKLDIGDIDESWENEPETFVRYNVIDCKLVVDIDEKAGII